MPHADIRTRIRRPLSVFLAQVVTGVSYYLAAAVSLFLTRGNDGIATVWPSSGVLLAVLLVTQRNQIAGYVVAAAIGSIAANLHAGNTVVVSIGFTVANMSEALLATWLHRHCRISFSDPGSLICFCRATFLATTAGATIALAIAPAPSHEFWLSWLVTDLLGVLIVTPLLLIAGRIVLRADLHLQGRAVMHATVLFAMVTVVTALTFSQTSYPLLFVPMFAVLVTTFRLGPPGAAGSVLVVTVVSAVAISVGSGPQAMIDAEPFARSLFTQFYLLALFASALPVAMLLAARAKLTDQLAEKMRLLQLAEGAAHVGHWSLDTRSETITWSAEVFRIHGIDNDVSPTLDAAIKAYHVEDRALVTEHVEEAIRCNRGFRFKARIVRPNGEIRHVFSCGEIDRHVGDGAHALFGIVQDITAQVAYESALDNARKQAEAAAEHAMIMAETDQLTGIANRRRISVALEQAVQKSRESRRPVAIAMFDIDHFKRINDTYGHQAGDEVLKRVTSDARRELRGADTLGRFGGEEFVILLPDATSSIAITVAERVRVAIEAGGINPRVTISIGVAELAAGEDFESLLNRADQALYMAKREGRNALRLAA